MKNDISQAPDLIVTHVYKLKQQRNKTLAKIFGRSSNIEVCQYRAQKFPATAGAYSIVEYRAETQDFFNVVHEFSMKAKPLSVVHTYHEALASLKKLETILTEDGWEYHSDLLPKKAVLFDALVPKQSNTGTPNLKLAV
jgi:hypothetical protein